MGLLIRMREWWQRRGEERIVARLIPAWRAARPLPHPHDYVTLAEEGYRRNALIFACVTELATSVAEPAVEVVRARRRADDQVLPDTHPLALLLARPNPEESAYTFLERMVVHLNVAGNAFVHKVRARLGRAPVQLWLLRPDRVRIVPDATGHVERYEYAIDGTKAVAVPAEDVIHIPFHPDPLDDYYGLSPIAALARFGDIDNEAADYLRAFFLNAGVPAHYLKLKGQVPSEERERLKQRWRDEMSGLSADGEGRWRKPGWHGLAVLDEDAELREMGSKLDSLRLDHVWDIAEARICSAFGVPPILVGSLLGLKRSTLANYREARRSFWEETLAPMYRRIAEALTAGLAMEFDAALRIRFNLDDVQALRDDLEARRKWALDAWDKGLLTRNAALRLAGQPELEPEAGEVFKVRNTEQVVPVTGQLQRRAQALAATVAEARLELARLNGHGPGA